MVLSAIGRPQPPLLPQSARPLLRTGVVLALGLALFGPTGCTPGRSPRPPATSTGGDSSPPGQPGADSRPRVLTTFTVIADMAREVAGDRLDVESITKLGAEIHGYEPTPSDLQRASGARLILENGLNLERWADRFQAGLPGVPRVILSTGITPLPITEDAGRGKPNPHAWMSPQLAEIYVENIRAAFTRLDPAGAATYQRRAEAYRRQLRQLDAEFRRDLGALPAQQRVLATCEGAFSYLARDYGLTEAYLWPVNGESQVTPQRMARMIDLVRRRRVPAVFCESTVSDEAQREVAQEAGSRFGGVFYVDSLSLPSGPASTLLQLQRHNLRTLVNGLRGGAG